MRLTKAPDKLFSVMLDERTVATGAGLFPLPAPSSARNKLSLTTCFLDQAVQSADLERLNAKIAKELSVSTRWHAREGYQLFITKIDVYVTHEDPVSPVLSSGLYLVAKVSLGTTKIKKRSA